MLLGAFLVVRVLQQVLRDVDMATAAEAVGYVWLMVCIYTWIGPGLFRRKVQDELGAVRLKNEF